jgi:bifunctional enzyme CysN/CysC
MGPETLKVGERVRLKLATQETGARIVQVERSIDASTLEVVEGARDHIATNDVAEVVIEADAPLVFDPHEAALETLGRFVLVHNRRVAGGGIVFGEAPAAEVGAPGSRNIVWAEGKVTPAEAGGEEAGTPARSSG